MNLLSAIPGISVFSFYTRCLCCSVLLGAVLAFAPSHAQVTGEDPVSPGEKPKRADTTMVFTSPRPLLAVADSKDALQDAWGLDILFSGNGFGLGTFYYREFSETLFGFAHLGISGVQSTDEFEEFDPFTQQWIVPNKVNRLFMFPMTVGVQYRLFESDITENFRPFVQAGIGPTLIMATPYSKEFFSSFSDASFYVRPGGFVGAGLYFGDSQKNITGAHIRYYFIPFGGDGLESVQGFPINNFGGIFLSLSVGILN